MIVEIKYKLICYGLTGEYLGFEYIAYALYLMFSSEGPVQMKTLYLEVAKKYGTKPGCVERNIRTAGEVLWRENIRKLPVSSGEKRPSNAKLLHLLAISIQKSLKAKEKQENFVSFCD